MNTFITEGIVAEITETQVVSSTLSKQLVTIAEDNADPTLEPRMLTFEFLVFTQKDGKTRDYTQQLKSIAEGMPVTVGFAIKRSISDKGTPFHGLRGITIRELA